ncbi:GNAT family N-acetyltransferase [Plantactinospora sp. CA-290183]|uniref:GNAT family N-acetyltransferase n=1 Tax=Plantactinospora sp. CA-290183 TaxID=3240006 RepID=UPI003D8B33CB
MPDDDPAVQVATAADWAGIHLLLRTAFHALPDEAHAAAEGAVFEPERSLLVRSGEEVVAHAAAFTRELTVPGAVVPAAHVTMVAVASTHRRRGLLTRLMRHQLTQVHTAGREPIALLWASEAPIYQRFGYGLAAQLLSMEINTTGVRLVDAPAGPPEAGTPAGSGVRLRVAGADACQAELAQVYERLRAERPGWSSRNGPWWRYVLGDFPSRQFGGTERRVLLAEGPAGPTGYAVWRTRSHWDERGPQGTVVLDELVAADPTTYRELWRFLLGIDLTRTVSYGHGAVDEPLQHLVDEPRQLGARLGHALWVRIVDVAGALGARRYASDVDAVIEVTDPLLPANSGRWRLTVTGGAARCRRTGEPAELACDVRDLAAAYLGGPSLGALAAAGRVRELRPGVLAPTSAAFGWHRAPAGIEVF